MEPYLLLPFVSKVLSPMFHTTEDEQVKTATPTFSGVVAVTLAGRTAATKEAPPGLNAMHIVAGCTQLFFKRCTNNMGCTKSSVTIC